MNKYTNHSGGVIGSLLVALFLATAPVNLTQSQTWEVGAFVGLAVYHGELTPPEHLDYFQLLRPAGGLFVRYRASAWLRIRLAATAMQLHGSSTYTPYTIYRDSPVEMRTPLHELALTFEVSPMAMRLFGLDVRPFSYTGVAVCQFEPQLSYSGQWIKPQPLGTEGQGLAGQPEHYATTRPELPLGLGLRVALSQRVNLGLELNVRLPFTDYLDDISGGLVNYPRLLAERGEFIANLSNPQGTESTGDFRRGNPGKDAYLFGGASFSYVLNTGNSRRVRCPTF